MNSRSSDRLWNFRGGWVGLMMILLSACSGGTQENHHPLLASSWGGTAGGPISGRLEVQVFQDVDRNPYPGALVALGDSGKVTVSTNDQGIAVFTGVSGPQDIHVYACAGCNADPNNPTIPVLYQIASVYQVNASQVSIPVVPGNPSVSEGNFEGKVFNVERDETSYVAEIDELGIFKFQGPIGSTTYQWVNEESTPNDLTFVFTKDLDEWAALDPAGLKQGFNQVALVGKVINASKRPQPGVAVTARYFNGVDAGRPYYFNGAGEIDPGLNATTEDGRFLFLRLSPNNDLFVSAQQLGVGVGARYIHISGGGTTLFTLPVLSIVQQSVDLSGRVVSYREDFREEERKGVLSNGNVGVDAAVIGFSGDTNTQSFIADTGPIISGRYRSQGHLLPNSRYVAVILAGRTFRQTYQEVRFNTTSKTNYPLAAVPLDFLVQLVRQKKGDSTSGLAIDTAEILCRVVKQTGQIDSNGDPIVEPIANAHVAFVDNAGNEVPIEQVFDQTSSTGLVMAFDLAPGVYTVIATDPTTQEVLGRKTLPVYPNGVHLVELVKPTANPPEEITLGAVEDVKGNPISSLQFSLVGERPGPHCPQVGPGCTLPAAGEYFVSMDQRTGGGDYSIPVSASKRLLGLSSFRVSQDGSLNNATFAAGLGPLAAGGFLTLDLSFPPPPALVETTGSITLPTNFTLADVNAILIGAVAPIGKAFIGADPTAFLGQTGATFRALSVPPEAGALSYFAVVSARNSKGESSQVQVQDLSAIPAHQDVTLVDPPRLVSPAPGEAVMVKMTNETVTAAGNPPEVQVVATPSPHLVWAAPAAGPVDFYRVTLKSQKGDLIWEAWVSGSRTEITLPSYPSAAPAELNPFAFADAASPPPVTDNPPVTWKVEAVRAGGLSLDEFTFRQLAKQRLSVAGAESTFIPRWINNKESTP